MPCSVGSLRPCSHLLLVCASPGAPAPIVIPTSTAADRRHLTVFIAGPPLLKRPSLRTAPRRVTRVSRSAGRSATAERPALWQNVPRPGPTPVSRAASTCREPSSATLFGDMGLDPAEHHPGDFVAVPLDEHEVPISLDADVLQPEPRVLHPGLGEELRRARVPRGVVARRAREEQDGHRLQVRELPDRLG